MVLLRSECSVSSLLEIDRKLYYNPLGWSCVLLDSPIVNKFEYLDSHFCWSELDSIQWSLDCDPHVAGYYPVLPINIVFTSSNLFIISLLVFHCLLYSLSVTTHTKSSILRLGYWLSQQNVDSFPPNMIYAYNRSHENNVNLFEWQHNSIQ